MRKLIFMIICIIIGVTLTGCMGNNQQKENNETSQKTGNVNKEIKTGVDKNKSNISKKSFLKAVRTGDIQKVRTYINNGGNVNVKYEIGQTVLMMAVLEGNKEIVKLLIKNGANVNAKLSLEKKYTTIGEGVPVTDGTTSLIIAAGEGYKNIVKILIANGANINVTNEYGASALMMAALEGNKEIVKLLIENGADINAKLSIEGEYTAISDGTTALMAAALEGNKEIVKLLINNGARVDIQNDEGKTVLDIAIEEGYYDLAKYIVDNGNDTISKDKLKMKIIRDKKYKAKQARDAVRSSDFNGLFTSLSVYFSDNGVYPGEEEYNLKKLSNSNLKKELVPRYTASLPSDPKENRNYYYTPITKNSAKSAGALLVARAETSEQGNMIAEDINDLEDKLKGKDAFKIPRMLSGRGVENKDDKQMFYVQVQ